MVKDITTFIFEEAFQIFLVSVKLFQQLSGCFFILRSFLILRFLFLHQVLNSTTEFFFLPRIFI